MNKAQSSTLAFSLVEVTLVLGVAVFCLIAIFSDYNFVPVAEIQPTPGVLADANNNIIVASQVMGVGANNKGYIQ
jgi:hypothetical protein